MNHVLNTHSNLGQINHIQQSRDSNNGFLSNSNSIKSDLMKLTHSRQIQTEESNKNLEKSRVVVNIFNVKKNPSLNKIIVQNQDYQKQSPIKLPQENFEKQDQNTIQQNNINISLKYKLDTNKNQSKLEDRRSQNKIKKNFQIIQNKQVKFQEQTNQLMKEQKRIAEQQNKVISIDLNQISPSSLQTIQNLRNVINHSSIENNNMIKSRHYNGTQIQNQGDSLPKDNILKPKEFELNKVKKQFQSVLKNQDNKVNYLEKLFSQQNVGSSLLHQKLDENIQQYQALSVLKLKNKKKTSTNEFNLEEINSKVNGHDIHSFGNLDILNAGHALTDIKHINYLSPRANAYKYQISQNYLDQIEQITQNKKSQFSFVIKKPFIDNIRILNSKQSNIQRNKSLEQFQYDAETPTKKSVDASSKDLALESPSVHVQQFRGLKDIKDTFLLDEKNLTFERKNEKIINDQDHTPQLENMYSQQIRIQDNQSKFQNIELSGESKKKNRKNKRVELKLKNYELSQQVSLSNEMSRSSSIQSKLNDVVEKSNESENKQFIPLLRRDKVTQQIIDNLSKQQNEKIVVRNQQNNEKGNLKIQTQEKYIEIKNNIILDDNDNKLNIQVSSIKTKQNVQIVNQVQTKNEKMKYPLDQIVSIHGKSIEPVQIAKFNKNGNKLVYQKKSDKINIMAKETGTDNIQFEKYDNELQKLFQQSNDNIKEFQITQNQFNKKIRQARIDNIKQRKNSNDIGNEYFAANITQDQLQKTFYKSKNQNQFQKLNKQQSINDDINLNEKTQQLLQQTFKNQEKLKILQEQLQQEIGQGGMHLMKKNENIKLTKEAQEINKQLQLLSEMTQKNMAELKLIQNIKQSKKNKRQYSDETNERSGAQSLMMTNNEKQYKKKNLENSTIMQESPQLIERSAITSRLMCDDNEMTFDDESQMKQTQELKNFTFQQSMPNIQNDYKDSILEGYGKLNKQNNQNMNSNQDRNGKQSNNKIDLQNQNGDNQRIQSELKFTNIKYNSNSQMKKNYYNQEQMNYLNGIAEDSQINIIRVLDSNNDKKGKKPYYYLQIGENDQKLIDQGNKQSQKHLAKKVTRSNTIQQQELIEQIKRAKQQKKDLKNRYKDNQSHLQLQKQFKSFGEYAEHLMSPTVLNSNEELQNYKLKIHLQFLKQKAQNQLLMQQMLKQHEQSGKRSVLNSETQLSNREQNPFKNLNKGNKLDLVGFTTQNRTSIFNNASMLSNIQEVKIKNKYNLFSRTEEQNSLSQNSESQVNSKHAKKILLNINDPQKHEIAFQKLVLKPIQGTDQSEFVQDGHKNSQARLGIQTPHAEVSSLSFVSRTPPPVYLQNQIQPKIQDNHLKATLKNNQKTQKQKIENKKYILYENKKENIQTSKESSIDQSIITDYISKQLKTVNNEEIKKRQNLNDKAIVSSKQTNQQKSLLISSNLVDQSVFSQDNSQDSAADPSNQSNAVLQKRFHIPPQTISITQDSRQIEIQNQENYNQNQINSKPYYNQLARSGYQAALNISIGPENYNKNKFRNNQDESVPQSISRFRPSVISNNNQHILSPNFQQKESFFQLNHLSPVNAFRQNINKINLSPQNQNAQNKFFENQNARSSSLAGQIDEVGNFLRKNSKYYINQQLHDEKQQKLNQKQQSRLIQAFQKYQQNKEIEPIIENSIENKMVPWLGSNDQLDEWGDSGLYDQIIKKNNIKSINHKQKKRV